MDIRKVKRLESSIKKLQLNTLWVGDKSDENLENLPDPDVIAREISENLESALEQFRNIYEDRRRNKRR